MKAVILVGGQGTRLRPLTLHTPKPLLPLVNRPFFDHVLYLLKQHGITDVILAIGYRSEGFITAYGDGSHLGVKLTYVREERPLDTGWAIKNVQSHLDPNETFLVFNGDILTDLDLTDMIRFHRERGSVCTISLTPVEDPSAYGVVDMDDTGRVLRFTEKPRRQEATSNWINAGTYLLEPAMLDYISEPRILDEIPPGRPYSVEYGLFPHLLHERKPVYGYGSNAYWMDIGTPAKYLQAHIDLLTGKLSQHMPVEGERIGEDLWAGAGTFIHKSARISGPVVLGADCQVTQGALIEGPTVLGDGCRVEADAELIGIVAWDHVTFAARSRVRNSIVATEATIGPETTVDDGSVVGDHAHTGAGNHLSRGLKLQPGVSLPDSGIAF
ncbi:MAG: NDP-sugar synthase [Chloroflexia bacterium]